MTIQMKVVFGIISFIFISSSAFPCEILKGKVVGVTDGDTIVILKKKKEIKIRLAGVDSPEKKQPFYQRAKAFTSEKVFGKKIKILVEGKDPYQRKTGEVFYKGMSLNEELVTAGLAWVDPRFSKSLGLKSLQNDAQKSHRGLWIEPHPLPPWEFRGMKKNGKKEKPDKEI